MSCCCSACLPACHAHHYISGWPCLACPAALHDTNGRWDLLAQLRAENLAELSRVLERVRLVRGIRSTETSIHLETYRVA